MPYLLRVQLPDVPGSLGRLASAIGEAGGDIEAIEIVEKNHDGTAVDDVLLETPPGVMPDSVVSACNQLEGVRVIWISRYAAGGNLFLDLEAVEALTEDPYDALNRLVELLPVTFRSDWAVRVDRTGKLLGQTDGAPEAIVFPEVERPERLPELGDALLAGARVNGNEVVILGRRGGPEFLDSELARLGHLVSLASSIATADR